jgi:tetratricopeptide (TPR) repeat protein
MGFLKKLFGGRLPSKQPEVPPPNLAKSPQDPAQDPNMIRVFDAYGRELFIPKEEWRKSLLPEMLRSNWNKPDALYNIIISALNDGFRSDVIAAAEQLYKIDPQPLRAACIWGIVLMEEGRLDEAEKVFRDFMAKHGESGVILTNLAKVYSHRKDEARAEEILWRGLQLDPNQDNGVGWYEVMHRECGGDAAGEEALRRIAAIPKSWRAQLWLARAALQRRDLARALSFYQESLAAAGQPVPHDLLMQMSGDLGKAGHLIEMLNLTEPRFDPAFHGLMVGNNLIKAMSDLGQIEPARMIVQQLFAQNRPDWKQTLSFWDTELAKLHVDSAPAQPAGKLSVAMLAIEGPVWLPETSPAHELFPAPTSAATHVCFLGSSAETEHSGDTARQQLSDAPGRFSRALPLFLAEQVRFTSDSHVRTLVPWIQSGSGGFVLSGRAWADADAAHHARAGEPTCDYLILTHLKTKAEPWRVELRLIRTIDAKCLETTEAACPSTQTAKLAQEISGRLPTMLARHAGVILTSMPEHYSVPPIGEIPDYLLRLEQLLAVRCGGIDGVQMGFLSGEHEIIDGNIHLCLCNPQNPSARILLLQTITAMKRVRPEIVGEYREKLERLERDHPLDEPARAICERISREVFCSSP